MKILIRNPAPDNKNIQHFWGDYHYGASLAQSLVDLGCEVEIQYWPNWVESEADILLVLRGLRDVKEPTGNFNRKIVWLISHPADVPDEELRLFDTVLSGSAKHTAELVQKGFEAHTFLQCTDDRLFFPSTRSKADLQNAFIFVGNYRDAGRALLERAISAQLPLKIWGHYWARENHLPFVVGNYCPN